MDFDSGSCYSIYSVQSGEKKATAKAAGAVGAAAGAAAAPVDLDEILQEVGQFGRYQVTSYLLISLPIFFTVISGTSYVFTAGELDYRCRIPECDGPPGATGALPLLPPWLPLAVPFEKRGGQREPSRCLRYVPTHNRSAPSDLLLPACSPDLFLNTTTRCDSWVYTQDESTIASEFDITCDENQWKLTMVGTVNSIGYLVTTPIAGYASDRFGRKTILLSAILLASFSGLARSFADSYETFLFWEFLDMALGGSIYETAFVLGMELVGPERRVLGGAIISGFNGLGEVFLGVIAWSVPHWRWMLRVIYGPAVFLMLYYWLLPESVRWLMAHGRMSEAAAIIKKAARVNGAVLSDKYLSLLNTPLPPTLEHQHPLKDVSACLASDVKT